MIGLTVTMGIKTAGGADAEGTLVVSAKDKGTGYKEKINITNDQNILMPDFQVFEPVHHS